jgi:hypothetical protein
LKSKHHLTTFKKLKASSNGFQPSWEPLIEDDQSNATIIMVRVTTSKSNPVPPTMRAWAVSRLSMYGFVRYPNIGPRCTYIYIYQDIQDPPHQVVHGTIHEIYS